MAKNTFVALVTFDYKLIILLAKILIWGPVLQLMCTFSFCINPCKLTIFYKFPW